MKVSKNELMKIFDFILENKNVIIGDKGLFSRDTLTMIRAIVKGKVPNNFELTPEQKDVIAKAFIKSNNYFNEDTPAFLLKNEECIRVAIFRNINSLSYAKNVPDDLEDYITKKAKEDNLILNVKFPNYLKSNYTVALNSIKQKASTADFVNWEAFNEGQKNNLINLALNNGYVLTLSSCEFLTENLGVVLQSLKIDKENIKFASEKIKHHLSIFKYLLLNGYQYTDDYIKSRTLNYFLDEEVMDYCFRKEEVFGANKNAYNSYIFRFTKMYHIALNIFPLISSFDSVFQMVADEEWKSYRKDNLEYYENIFGKICTQLRNCDTYANALNSLKFREKLKDVLEEKYNTLDLAMKKYFILYHSNIPNKLEKLIPFQNIIAKMAALYIAKSKEYFKKDELKKYYNWLKPYFKLKLDNQFVYKKLIQSKKRNKFRELYLNDDKEICNFLTNIANKYKDILDDYTLKKIIGYFVEYKYSKFDSIISSPDKYENFERYEKAVKLIHRLNSGYIKYDGVELTNYKDIIAYDENKKEYIYTGITFGEKDLEKYQEYRKEEKIFEKIKKEIMQKVKTIEVDDKVNSDLVDELKNKLPFTDEYFVFDEQFTLSEFSFKEFLDVCLDHGNGFVVNSLLDDKSFENIIKVVSNNGLFWLLLFMSRDSNPTLREHAIRKSYIIDLIDNMREITELAEEFKFDLSNFQELFLVYEMSKCANLEDVAILGKEVIEKLYKHDEYTNVDAEEIITMAKELVCYMAKRSKSTVPFVKGQTDNYKYSIYDSQDETILLAGIYTDACFRINGNDNDFLHYCALDKNGFVIKITDLFGNFIGRASGFRNGNCVFINQIRTIYDEGGNYYTSEDDNERKDIIETFKKACEDIVTTSQQNPNEINKIDYVFVTKSYAMENTDANVSDDVTAKIGWNPMDNKSEDWEEFIDKTKNLEEAFDKGCFDTDYGNYPLICMASAKSEEIKPNDIILENVEAVYERKRNKIIVTTSHEPHIINKLNKINGIKAYLGDYYYSSVEIPESAIIFSGDNWYIIFDGEKITSSTLLEFDSKAKIEFDAVLGTIYQYMKNKQQFSLEQIADILQADILNNETMRLKLIKKF